MMVSPYEKLNYFYINEIPFLPLAKRGQAVNCRIGLSKQLVFIPVKYIDIDKDDIKLKNNVNLAWWFWKKDTQKKVQLYKQEMRIT